MFQLNSQMTVHIPTRILSYEVSALKTYKIITVQASCFGRLQKRGSLIQSEELRFKTDGVEYYQFHVPKTSSSALTVGANVIRHNSRSACGNREIHAAAWKQTRMKLI